MLINELSVGFVGVGNIGRPMAERLAEEFSVCAYDLKYRPGDDVGGLKIAEDLTTLARGADVVCLSLPSPEASAAVIESLVNAGSERLKLVIELSTIGPDPASTCGETVHRAGLGYVDAPVAGGIGPARSGGLTMMAAGSDEEIELARPILERLSKNLFIMGSSAGLGQVMKLTNNAISLSSLVVTSEAVTFATQYGLDMQKVVDVLNSTSGSTDASRVKFPASIIPGTYSHGSPCEMPRKDVRLYVAHAKKAGVPVLMLDKMQEVWGDFVTACPEADASTIYRYINGLTQKPGTHS